MRFAALDLLFGLAPCAVAQSQFTEEKGAFLTFDEFTFQNRGSVWGGGGKVGAGWRFGNGADIALRGGYSANGLGDADVDGRGWSLGATTGYTIRPRARTIARVQGTVAYGRAVATFNETATRDYFDYAYSSFATDVSATLGYQVPLAGSLGLQPTIGVYGQADQLLSVETTPTLGGIRAAGDWRTSLGLHLAAPLTFRLLGHDAAVVPSLRYSLGGDAPVRGGTLGFRLNF